LVWNAEEDIISTIIAAGWLYQTWGIRASEVYELRTTPGRRKCLRLLESGNISTVWWFAPPRGPDGADSRDLALIADGIRVADSVGTGNVITAWPRDPIWEDKNINNALTSASGRISFTHTCAHQSPYRRRIEIATTRSQLDSVCLRCRAVTGPCEFTLRPRRTFYDATAADATVGGLWGNLWRSIAGAIVANATRRRELEEGARRHSGAVVGRFAAGDAEGVS